MQVAHDYFENAMAFFTDTIYNAIMARPLNPPFRLLSMTPVPLQKRPHLC